MSAISFFGGEFFGGEFFNTGSAAPVGPAPSGGYAYSGHEVRRRTADDIRRSREEFGVIPKQAEEVIGQVALNQAERLEIDQQKRFDELLRELQLRGIEFEARYLEALNAQREALINAEIARRIREKMADEEMLTLLLVAAAI